MTINLGVDLTIELGKTPVKQAGQLISAATAFRPSISIPLMPPPTPLCDGEKRAADGGVEPASTAKPARAEKTS